MGWADHAIWWHVYPLGFTGAPIREGSRESTSPPRLDLVIDWLDYAVELGVSGLLFGPFFFSSSHGYDTLDQYRIDPRLGTVDDFDRLLAECKKRGLRVLLDGVFSHVGRENPQVQRVLHEGPGSEDADLFDIDWDEPGGPAPRVFEGHGALVRLNHAHPATAKYVSDVMTFWLDRGIDGWRLDAAYSVPASFWAEVVPPLRSRFPEAWYLGEVIHGDYIKFVEESGVDSVTQYELWKAIWSALKDQNFFELDWALKRNNEFLNHFVPNTFVGNHDVTRIASTVGPERALMAFAILMTVGGIPSIYYGDEQGFTGVKEEREGGDDAVRPKMPDNPEGLPPSGAHLYTGHRDLIGLRRRHPWLATARTYPELVENTRYIYRSVSADETHFLTVRLDLDGEGSCEILDKDANVLWAKKSGRPRGADPNPL